MADSVQRPSFVPIEGTDYSSSFLQTMNWIYEFMFGKDLYNKFLIRSPYAVYMIVLSYVLIVKAVGPFLMRHRKPFKLKNIMIAYNISNALLSLILAGMMFYIMCTHWEERCRVKERSDSVQRIQVFYPVIWLWYLNKNYDLLDTLFFVLRKKNGHVSILHVFHHAGLILTGFAVIKFHAFSFYMVVGVLLNSLIHVLMYIYYTLAAFGPQMQKYLWWKKYMTQMQIGQFVIVLIYLTHAFATGCELMEAHELLVYFFIFALLILFLNFYRKNYKHHQN